MKRHLNYAIIFSLVTMAAMGMSACTESSKIITEEDVWEIMDEVETATRNKDIEGAIKFMAPSIDIYLTIHSPDSMFGPRNVHWTRQQYKNETLKAWSMASHFEYSRENEEITISEDGKRAIVENDVVEVMVVQGERIETVSHQRAILEIIDGKILVTRLRANIRMPGSEEPFFF